MLPNPIVIIVHIFPQSVEEEEQDLVYAVPVITRKKTVKSQDAEKEECFYTSVS